MGAAPTDVSGDSWPATMLSLRLASHMSIHSRAGSSAAMNNFSSEESRPRYSWTSHQTPQPSNSTKKRPSPQRLGASASLFLATPPLFHGHRWTVRFVLLPRLTVTAAASAGGCQIAAKSSEYLGYDSQVHQFNVSPQYDIDVNPAYISQADSSDLGELPDAPAVA
jgi:hypothetical protein